MKFEEFVSLLIIVGILIWFVYKYIPMKKEIRNILTIVLTVSIVFWVAHFFNMFNLLEGFHFGG